MLWIRWGKSEDALLWNAYSKGLVECRRVLPHRSETSIIRRAKRLGLSRAAANAKAKEWSGKDEMALKLLWPSAPREEIQNALPGRSWSSITKRAARLGLFRKITRRSPLARPSHPLLQELRQRMDEVNSTATDVQRKSRIKRSSVADWFIGYSEPKLCNFEKAVTALGGKIVIVWPATKSPDA